SGQLAITATVSLLGATALAARTYIVTLIGVVTVFSSAIGQAAQILVGHLVGARRPQAAFSLGFHSLLCALACSAVCGALLCKFSRPLVGAFTTDADLVGLIGPVTLIAVGVELGKAINLVLAGSLKGAGDVWYPALLSFAGLWVGVLAAYMLGVQC